MEEIVNKLGKNHLDPCVVWFGNMYEDAYGIYTYKGKVYCIHTGIDHPFEDIDRKMQPKLIDAILNNNYEVNPSFQ